MMTPWPAPPAFAAPVRDHRAVSAVQPDVLHWHRCGSAPAVARDRSCRSPAAADRASWRRSSPPPSLPSLRSEEHTSELQSLMRISYAVFCLKKKNNTSQHHTLATRTNIKL